VRGVSGRDASLLVHYARTSPARVKPQTTACVLNATEVSRGVVN